MKNITKTTENKYNKRNEQSLYIILEYKYEKIIHEAQIDNTQIHSTFLIKIQ